jgi:hypothetical protein
VVGAWAAGEERTATKAIIGRLIREEEPKPGVFWNPRDMIESQGN